MSDARWYAVWPEPRSRSLKGSRPSVPHGTNFWLLFQYRDEIIWFPHNMDFRGRIYPMSTLFNHFGMSFCILTDVFVYDVRQFMYRWMRNVAEVRNWISFDLCSGNDVARSMLVFAKGKPLGADGLDWLKIHLVNLTGFKKRFSA